MFHGRPENRMPPDMFYNKEEAKKYTKSTRILDIQSKLTQRCIELLNLGKNDKNLFILDIGCGSGLSGTILSQNDHIWVGIDISVDMLNVARQREVQGDLYVMDMGQGFKFRSGAFDAAVSVSALQWLCVASRKEDNPFHRLKIFFQSLYNSLRAGGRAVLQFYPDGKQQLEMISNAAMKCGFSGGIVVDYPHSTKAKKLYLVIDAGGGKQNQDIVMVQGKVGEDGDSDGDDVSGDEEEQKDNKQINVVEKQRKMIRKTKKNLKAQFKSKQWIVQKKEKMQSQGQNVKKDSKYSGRKRSLIRLLQ